jgi:hypothetical protein
MPIDSSKLPPKESFTVVTGDGEVLRQGEKGFGVMIVDSESCQQALFITEVSDDETINLFCDHNGAVYTKSKVSDFEILIVRKNR